MKTFQRTINGMKLSAGFFRCIEKILGKVFYVDTNILGLFYFLFIHIIDTLATIYGTIPWGVRSN